MNSSIYLLLGMDEHQPLAEVKRRYARMMESLCPRTERLPVEAQRRMGRARERLSEAYERMKNPEVRAACGVEPAWEAPERGRPPKADVCRPKLGQMLVAAGLLTLEELDAALEIQRNTGTMHIPLGELLVGAGYLTRQQLGYYLRLQKVMELPSDHPSRWGQRLVELGMVSEDQLKVALIEQKSTGCTLRQALINRGWLTAEELDRIF